MSLTPVSRTLAKRVLPRPVQRLARSVYHGIYRMAVGLWCGACEVRERWLPVPDSGDGLPLPPARFRFQVGGTPSRSSFLETGRLCCENLVRVMEESGHPLSSPGIREVLDFGCGCGRTLRWLGREFDGKRFTGTDADEEMIGWCRRHLNFAEFTSNPAWPPLPFSSGRFDFVYAISVFTHLPEAMQRPWLEELARVTAPGGVVLLTVHGEAVWSRLPDELHEQVRREGMLTTFSDKLRGFFPSWYQTSFHTEGWVRQTAGGYFPRVRYLPEGMGYLDVAVCETGR